jgi:pimeloyl-ACP methyl ester carboxylesterase
VLTRLEAEHSVMAPTLPGHYGGPALPEGVDPTVGAIADALEGLLDDHGIERAHIAGNSMGGWLALELARRGRASSVVALSPGGAWSSQLRMALVLGQVRAAVPLMRLLGGGRVDWLLQRPRARRIILRQMAVSGDRIDPSNVAAFIRDVTACPTFKPLVKSLLGRQLEPVGASVRCPIRIAWGELDRLIPLRRFGPVMRERVPHAEFTVLPGVGHVPMADDPELVARTILDVTRSAETTGRSA